MKDDLIMVQEQSFSLNTFVLFPCDNIIYFDQYGQIRPTVNKHCSYGRKVSRVLAHCSLIY